MNALRFPDALLALAASAALVAAAQGATSDAPAPAATATARAPISHDDLAFMRDAAEATHAQLLASERALMRASDPEVKEYAARMIEEHSRHDAELRKLAGAKGVALPLEPSAAQKQQLDSLDRVHGRDFERQYLEAFGNELHRAALARYQSEVDRGQDADVRAFARRETAALEQYWSQALAEEAGTGTRQQGGRVLANRSGAAR